MTCGCQDPKHSGLYVSTCPGCQERAKAHAIEIEVSRHINNIKGRSRFDQVAYLERLPDDMRQRVRDRRLHLAATLGRKTYP